MTLRKFDDDLQSISRICLHCDEKIKMSKEISSGTVCLKCGWTNEFQLEGFDFLSDIGFVPIDLKKKIDENDGFLNIYQVCYPPLDKEKLQLLPEKTRLAVENLIKNKLSKEDRDLLYRFHDLDIAENHKKIEKLQFIAEISMFLRTSNAFK